MGQSRKTHGTIHFTDYDRQVPGTNGCDFVPVMQELKDIHCGGYVAIKTSFSSRGNHPDSIARWSLENFKGD